MPDDLRTDPDRWERIARLFDQAVDLPLEERGAWLRREAGEDAELLDTVRRMLAADADDRDLLGEGIAPAAHLVLEAEVPLRPGTKVGAFDVIGELGRGGMGTVYAAKDRHLDRPVALKFLQLRPGSQRNEAERIIAEARAASALDHPNVAAIYQVGESDDRYFIAMPRYEGQTLRSRLSAGPISVPEALAIARQIASGLAAAHRAGIVHRDITPGNIFLTSDGTVKILDFGIAALSGAHDDEFTGGTVAYMSPEQATGGKTDARSDVWSLGIVMFRMLTAELPVVGGTDAKALTGRPGIPPALGRVVDRALSINPERRYHNAGELLAALDAAAAPRRLPHRAIVAGLALAALGSAWGATSVGTPPTESSPPPPVLAVLPVSAVAADSGATALVRAMVDEAMTRISLVGVRVLPHATDSSASSELEPGHFRLRVTLEPGQTGHLLNATVSSGDADRVVWAQPRAFTSARLRDLSEELADRVLRQLGVELSAREHAALAAGLPSSVEAYQALLAGNQLIRRRTPTAVLEAIDRYRDARELDPSFVAAFAREAYAISLLADWGWRHPTLGRDELLAQGVALSDRALALDSGSADAWMARAYLLATADPKRMSGALDAFRRAIALDPYNAEAFHQYGQVAMLLGRFDEAATAYRRTLELQPGAAMSLVSMAGLAELQGRRDEVRRLLDSAVAVAPRMAFARSIRALLRCYDGDFGGAESDARAAAALDSTFRAPALAALAMALAGKGDTAAAEQHLAEARASLGDPLAPTADEAHMLVSALLALGHDAEAASVVARVRPRGAALWYLFLHPSFDALKRDPAAAAVFAEADPRRS